ncbi:MAG: M1 family aminopeptidase [Candidatus Eisenbacteria bacterium]
MKERPFVLLLAAILVLLPAAGIAGDEDPVEQFRRLEWERRALSLLAGREAAAKIPFHEPVYDVTFYDLSVRVDPSDSSLVGEVWVHARSLADTLSNINLDLVDSLDVDSVGGNGISFTHANDLVTIVLDGRYDPGEPFAVKVCYGGKPRPYRRNGLLWKTHGTQPAVFTMVEPFFSGHWWPCKDVPWDKADSAEVTITAPEELVGISNGVHVITTQPEPGWKSTTWKHRHPIPPYLIMIAVSNYELIGDVFDNGVDPAVTIEHWVFPEDRVAAETTFALVPEMIERLEEIYGPYPFRDERFGHAAVVGAGAMEHNTCVSFGASLIVGNRGSDAVVVHELGHQWWGDLVTCEDWNDIWLNEGFATYTEALWAEHRAGPEILPGFMKREEYHGSQSVYVDPIPDLDSLFSPRFFGAIYNKGGWVLHMLRRLVGDETFFQIFERHKEDSIARGGLANTADFHATCEAVSGLDLDRFFRQWVYLAGSPSFRALPFVSASGETLWLRLAQDIEQDTCFAADIELTIGFASGADTVIAVPVRTFADTFVVAPGGEIASVRFDEENWLLDKGFAGPVDSVLTIEEIEGIRLDWEVTDPFVGGVFLYSASSVEGPWERVMPTETRLPKDGWYEAERPEGIRYFLIRAVSDSLPGYESTPSNIVRTSTPAHTVTLFDSTATNPYLLGGDPYGIRFNLARPSNVSIRVFDISGRLVRTVHEGALSAGYDIRREWDGRNGEGRFVSPGVYFVRFEAEEYKATRKVVVLR